MTDPDRVSEGTSSLIHMMLLARAPERILALRLAMTSSIGPESTVLDAGCGSLGVLAIMAARLGAQRVVAADIGRLDAARALAEENGVADRIEFLECDLAELPRSVGNVDVILGMIYHNEPRRDLAQQQLMAGIAYRFAHDGTVIIPDTVRYTVTGYDSAGPDPTDDTLQDRWHSAVGQAQALTGITMRGIQQFPSDDYSAVLEQLSQLGRPAARPLSAAERDMKLLTSRQVFTEVRYADPASAAAYPPSLALTVTAPGRLDTTIWRQDLKFGDLLIRRSESIQPVTAPRDVEPGDTVTLATDGSWSDAPGVHVRRNDHT